MLLMFRGSSSKSELSLDFMLSRVFTLTLLLGFAPACGGGDDDDANDDATDDGPCFTVTPDAEATAVGAIAGEESQCLRGGDYRSQTGADGSAELVTQIAIEGEGGPPAPGPWGTAVALELTYVDTRPAPASFHATDRCGFGSPSVKVLLGYAAYDAADGVYSQWSCTTCMDQSATFDLSITSVEGQPPTSVENGPLLTNDTVHGTLHAVCSPSTSPAMGDKSGAGNVTIDGPF